jgi:NAD(P)H-nitrite reductase large subunit
MDGYKYLLIGNSASSVGAVEAVRRLDKQGSIAVVSEEPYFPYSRPLIAEYLAGERDLDGILYRSSDFYERNGVAPLLGKRVVRLDVEGHTVRMADGADLAWEKLLLATGGTPIFPPTEGGDRKGVFTFTTLGDAQGIRDWLDGVRRVVVIGGGLIGISVTDALHRLGLKVSVVELKDRVLNTILDMEASRIVEARLARAGVELVTDRYVKEIVGRSSRPDIVGGAVLDDGRGIPCDMVVVAIGVVPRTELAKGTSIRVNRGIVVDRRMNTSHPDVYACGDVAEAYDFVLGSGRVIPIWPTAYIGGRTAGFNMAGGDAEYPGGTPMNSLKYFGLPIVAAGMFDASREDGYEEMVALRGGVYRKVVLRDGVLVGMTFVGDIARAGIVFNLLREGADVSGYKQALLADELGLASLPEEVWQGRMERALEDITLTAPGPMK